MPVSLLSQAESRRHVGRRAVSVALTALLLTGCAAMPSPQPTPSASAERKAAGRNVWVCLISTDPGVLPKVFFGSEMYPDTYWRGNDGSTGTGSISLRTNEWICNDSSASQASKWLPDTMDTYATITWPDGRIANFGIQNPLFGTPKFYPSLGCASSGPTCKGEARYALDEGDTYKCSTVGYDVSITRNGDLPNLKYYEIRFGSASGFDGNFDSEICAKA